MTVFYCFYCSFRYLYPKPFKIFSPPSTLLLFFHFLRPSFFQVCVKGEQNISKSLPLPHTSPFFKVFFFPFHEEARGLYLYCTFMYTSLYFFQPGHKPLGPENVTLVECGPTNEQSDSRGRTQRGRRCFVYCQRCVIR